MKVGFQNYTVVLYLIAWETSVIFSVMTEKNYIPITGVLHFLYNLKKIAVFFVSHIAILTVVRLYLIFVMILNTFSYSDGHFYVFGKLSSFFTHF